MPNKKQYAEIKRRKAEDAAWQATKLSHHEQDVVMMVYYLRDRMQKVQKEMNRDLRLMTGENPVFLMNSAQELASILEHKKMIDAMIIANNARDASFEERILKRVAHIEAKVREEKAKNAALSETQPAPAAT